MSSTVTRVNCSGVIAFTKWVAKDGGRYGILVNAICPGPIQSDMTRGYTYNVQHTELCDYGQSIRVLQTHEICTLGSFTKVAPAHA